MSKPLAHWQYGIGIGQLLEHHAACVIQLGKAPTHPIQPARPLQRIQATPGAALADIGDTRNRRYGRIETPATIVQKIKQQNIQHGQGIPAERAVLPTGSPRARSKRCASCHRCSRSPSSGLVLTNGTDSCSD
jgi:hypothetical protein